MPRTASRRTTTKAAKSSQEAKILKPKNQCTLSIKPTELSQNLKLLNTAIGCNQKGLDRLKIEVGDGQSIFTVAGDTIELKVKHKATKAQNLEPIQVSCKQFNDLASRLDNSTQKLELSQERVSITNRKETYALVLNTYKDVLPQNKSEFTPIASVKADKFKQALDSTLPFLNSDTKEVTSGVCLQIQRLEDESLALILTGLSNPGMGTTTTIVEEVEVEDLSETRDEELKLVLPRKAISFIATNAKDFILSIAGTSVKFDWSNTECILETIQSDEYPNLDEIKESLKDNDFSIGFNRLDLLDALKRQQVMSQEVELAIEDNNCRLSHATEKGSGAENLFCDCDRDEPISLCLHTDYLIKVILLLEEQTVQLKLNLEAEREERGSSRVVIEERNSMYCLAQLVSN